MENLLVYQFNNTNENYPKDKLIHQLFEEQVNKTPDNIALVFEDEKYSYFLLNARANQLARTLRKKGIKPNSIVAIISERSVEMIISILAILKAGAAYLPIDPNTPEERIKFMFYDTNISLILNIAKYKLISNNFNIEIINFDNSIFDSNSSNLTLENTPFDLAYIIYTSGSTGQPKGVMIEHRSVINLITSLRKRIFSNYTGYLRICLISSPVFDVSVEQIFKTLLNGDSLFIVPENIKLNGKALLEFYKHNKINISGSTPSHINMILNSIEEPINLPDMKHYTLGGENLSSSTIKQFFKKIKGNFRIINLYGPTEYTVDTTLFTITRENSEILSLIPIGKPIDNTKILIIDKNNNLCPLEITGELCISGVGLARGYINRPELTKEKFVINPFFPEEKMYRTGDLARWKTDGNIEYIGRIDDQIKIRGFRIELGEIETTLSKYPGIKEVIIIAKKKGEDTHLIAYFTSKNKLEISDVRMYLSKSLPKYMVPSFFIQIEVIPLNINGKVDKKALPNYVVTNSKEYIAPTNQTEYKLVDIWSQVLNIERELISITDNFFELGGHSLNATILISKINSTFATDITISEVFNYQTIQTLSGAIIINKDISSANPYYMLINTSSNNLYDHFLLTELQKSYHLGETDLFPLGKTIAHSFNEFEFNHFNIDNFSKALQKLINLHPILKGYVLPEGKWKILKEVPEYKPNIIDYSNLSELEKENKLNLHREFERENGIRTDIWPLFSFSFYLLGSQRIILHSNICLILFDGFSKDIFFKDLVSLYNNINEKIHIPELSFRDYVIGIQNLKKSNSYQVAKTYWLKRLISLPDVPELPLVKSPLEVIQSKLTNFSIEIDNEKFRKLCLISAKNKLTLNIVIYCVFAKVLGFWSKSKHFCINELIHNRFYIHKEVTNVIGNFSSTILLETKILKDEIFIDFAKRTLLQQLNDLENSLFNGVEVLHEYNRMHKRFTAGMPVVFTSTLTFTDSSNSIDSVFGKVNISEVQTPQVYLDYSVYEKNGNLVINWAVQEDLFPKGLIKDMFNTNVKILSELAEDENMWKSSINLTLPQKQIELLQFNNYTDSTISEKCLHTLFFESAKKNPNNIAIINGDFKLTYKQLYQKVYFYSEKLKELNIKPNSLVAVVMEKGWEQIVAVLAILAIGAAYIPINTNFPEERILELIKIGKVKVVLTNKKFVNKIQWSNHLITITIEENVKGTSKLIVEKQNPYDLAYVIFTSGSTGEPKGVMINHLGAVNTILDVNERFNLNEKDKVLAISELSFDLSVWDIFGTLSVGAALVIPSSIETKDPRALLYIIKENGITIWNSVPAFVQMYENYISKIKQNPKSNESLRLIMMSGDWIPVNLSDKIRKHLKNVSLVSMGGATEASIWSVIYYIKNIDKELKSIPYGKPMKNQKCYVLNEFLEDNPIMVSGELYIGGIGLAIGYWENKDITDKSFIYHPVKKERLYRTGDMGRYLPDGNIEFLGRIDTQVKIQGYRVECGEIETVISKLEFIKENIVIVKEINKNEKQLVSYLVLNEKKIENENFLRDSIKKFLTKKLPQYMIPKHYIFLSKLPINFNGKIDRNSLPDPLSSSNIKEKFILPRDEIEQKIHNIWCEILIQEKISINANFFEIGGHSITAVSLIVKIESILKKILPLPILMEYPTIEKLANFIKSNNNKKLIKSLVPLQTEGVNIPFFCVHAIGGHVFNYQNLANKLGRETPFYGLQSSGLDGQSPLYESVEDMAYHYLKSIRKIQKKGPYKICGWSFGGIIASEMAYQLESIGENIDKLILIDSWTPVYEKLLFKKTGNSLFSLFIQDLQGRFGFEDIIIVEKTTTQKLTKLLNKLKNLKILPDNFDLKQFKQLYYVYEKNMIAFLKYRPKTIKTSIELIKAKTPLNGFENNSDNIDSTYGWSKYSKVLLKTCSGDHYSIFNEPHLSELVYLLKNY